MDLPHTSSRREDAPQWRVPLGSYPDRQCRHPAGKARLAVHPPSACSGVKALRNTSDAKAASRQALLAFRSLDPFRALREPDRRRRDEERPSRSEQRTLSNQKHYLTGKAPYKFESLLLRWRVTPPHGARTRVWNSVRQEACCPAAGARDWSKRSGS